MKAVLIRDAEQENPLFSQDDCNRAVERGGFYDVPQFIQVSAGTVISGPKSYMLVRMGMAKPADEECAKRCGRTDAQIEAAVLAQERVSKGIIPEDYPRYDRGEMLGYNPDGSDIKGPNWDLYNSDTDEDEDDDGGDDE